MHRSAHFLSAILAFGVAAAPLQAQTPVETTVYAVAYVDVMPSGRSSAIAALPA